MDAFDTKLRTYFSEKGIYSSQEMFPKHIRDAATSRVFTHYQQTLHQEVHPEKPVKAYPITIDTMVGYTGSNSKLLDQFTKNAQLLGELFFFGKSTPNEVVYQHADVMVSGSTLPIRFDYQLLGESKIESIYLKTFDPIRVLGLAVYSLVSERGYPFLFDDSLIVEKAIEGKHIFDLPNKVARSKKYHEEKIELDCVSFFMGLNDIAKPDNYIVADQQEIIVIDFDVASVHDVKTQELIKDIAAQQLHMTRRRYDQIYAEKERYLVNRVWKSTQELLKICEVYSSSEDPFHQEIGQHITTNIETLLKKTTEGKNNE